MGFTAAYGRDYGDQLREAQRVLRQAQSIMEKVQIMNQQATPRAVVRARRPRVQLERP